MSSPCNLCPGLTTMRNTQLIKRFLHPIASSLRGPSVLAFLPALSLGAFWLGGERALVVTALSLPVLWAAMTSFDAGFAHGKRGERRPGGLMAKDRFDIELADTLDGARLSGKTSVCIALAPDDHTDLIDIHGPAVVNHMMEQCCARILSIVREGDLVTQTSGGMILMALRPSQQLDLEACIQMSGRIQTAVEDPIPLNGTSVYLSCSIGICLTTNLRSASAADWIEAAIDALAEAQRNGPSTIRAFSTETHRRSRIRTNLRKELETALDNGDIRPWFQPQISTDTGRITGFEALARWHHRQKGVLGPQVFLPFAEQADLMEQLGQTIRHHAFSAICAWDRAGVVVPRVGVNFSSDELRNPGLIDRLKWELDHFDLTPDRLAVEILETVFSRRPDDVITRNVTGLAALGCHIDLDDFGTGHASIASIKRFNVSRIKIDRSFVTKADLDPGQQQLASAILTMAERLQVETLAEGVETPGEHALMAQLGCNHVQGFGIAKPMPYEKTLDWIEAHGNKVKGMPKIGRQTG